MKRFILLFFIISSIHAYAKDYGIESDEFYIENISSNNPDSLLIAQCNEFIAIEDSSAAAQFLVLRSMLKKRRWQFFESRVLLDQAINIYELLNNQKGLAKCFYLYSQSFNSVEDKTEALEYAHKSYQIASFQNDNELLVRVNLALANFSNSNQLVYLNKARSLGDSLVSKKSKNTILYNFIKFYCKKGLFKKANSVFKEVIINSRDPKDSIAFNYHKGLYFFSKKEYRKAIKPFLANCNLFIKDVNSFDANQVDYDLLLDLPQNTLPLAESYFWCYSRDSCILWGNKTIEISNRLRDEVGIAKASFIMADVYSAKGNHEKSLRYFVKATALRDSIFNQNNRKRLKRVETKFELSRISNEMKILENEKLLVLKEQELSDAKAFRNYTLLLITLFVLIASAIAVFFNSRRKIKDQELKKASIEQRFLRSQLNPHFIFNSLASIQQYIEVGKGEKAKSYLLKSAQLIRFILEHSRMESITLEEEIEAIQSYLELQQLKSNDAFKFTFNIPENLEISLISIPPLILQPILENCVEHGFKGVKYLGEIIIDFTEVDDTLKITISDNGVGRSNIKVEEQNLLKKKSLATKITQERLELINDGLKNRITFKIIDLIDPSGTRVELEFKI